MFVSFVPIEEEEETVLVVTTDVAETDAEVEEEEFFEALCRGNTVEEVVV